MFGIVPAEVFAPMVFCKQCKQKVEVCPHFVDSIAAEKVQVVDERIDWLAYREEDRILEIAYKNGQVWQLSPVPPAIYGEIRDTTLWSFVKFIAQRYKAAPVKTGLQAIKVPESEKCRDCGADMTEMQRVPNAEKICMKVRWSCSSGCRRQIWREYALRYSGQWRD
jgi:hypothetical protein